MREMYANMFPQWSVYEIDAICNKYETEDEIISELLKRHVSDETLASFLSKEEEDSNTQTHKDIRESTLERTQEKTVESSFFVSIANATQTRMKGTKISHATHSMNPVAPLHSELKMDNLKNAEHTPLI